MGLKSIDARAGSSSGGPDDLGRLTAAILVGGLGTRLRSVLSDRPKVLAPVGGQPFVTYLLDQLLAAGVRRAVLCTGYGREQVQAACGRSHGRLAISYSHETEPRGTGGALRQALPLVGSDPVLVLNGDSYCDADLAAFLAWHRERQARATLMLVHVEDVARFGRVWVGAEDEITRFEEKAGYPVVASSAAREGNGSAAQVDRPWAGDRSGWISAGVYLLSRDLVSSIPANTRVSIERDLFPHWTGHALYGYRVGGRFLDIGTPETYARAETFFADLGTAARGGRPVAAR